MDRSCSAEDRLLLPHPSFDASLSPCGECGWCKDKWGLSWQITPIALTKAVTTTDPAAAKRAFDAMMQMKKIDIAAIEAARRG
jgi:predicted 3-demethylubiquinone-9 3-methyltransferase (glyoxalase superfamily)